MGSKRRQPHILFILADDIGWSDVGFNLAKPFAEVQTPIMDTLTAQGIHLLRHYVHMTCTGTRTALQSGRLPVHVQTSLKSPERPDAGMPRNMTGLAEQLQALGYRTHYVGKWDVGMATSKHIPKGRGYETSLGYFEHKNDYWTQQCAQSACCPSNDSADENSDIIFDLWDTDRPARDLVGTDYEEFIFLRRMLQIIDQHNIDKDGADEPLFLFYAPHIAHCPLQVPPTYLSKFDFMSPKDDSNQCRVQTTNVVPFDQPQPLSIQCRKQYRAMVHLLDDMIGQVVQRFVERDMWDDLLIVFTSDNGGPVRLIESGASNFPLRGGKYSPWEGGVRAAAFVSGGYLPAHRRGIQLHEPFHICDWYKTLAALAGNESVEDTLAAQSGLPAIDAVNVLPLLWGTVTKSPRQEIPLSKQALIVGDYKLIWNETVAWAGWSDLQYPHADSSKADVQDKVVNCTTGCLFNVAIDPEERNDVAREEPDRMSHLKQRLVKLRKHFFENNDRGVDSCPPGIDMPCACWSAINYYGGFLGPYQELDDLTGFVKETIIS